MTPEEVYQVWAPAESIWSPWAIAVPFAQMVCVDSATPPDLSEAMRIAAQFDRSSELAIVVDLPGGEAIGLGLALGQRGFRPVPVIDGSPGPAVSGLTGTGMDQGTLAAPFRVAVDMKELLRGLCLGASWLRDLTIEPDASPVFLLDATRLAEGRSIGREVFDNRWKTFPQDYPSARFLLERGIRRVILIKEQVGQPQEDLAHVLLRWQEGGIRLEVYGTRNGGRPRDLAVSKPAHFRALWQRALAIFGLQRGAYGGFRNWPHGTGGG